MLRWITRRRWRALEEEAEALTRALEVERLRVATRHRDRLLALAREVGALTG
jgi:hypothetical protein